MTMPAVVFSHGQESGPWGSKIKSMAATVQKLGCRAESVDYQGIADPSERVDKLIAECANVEEPLLLVGSSMGGHVATAAASTTVHALLSSTPLRSFMPLFLSHRLRGPSSDAAHPDLDPLTPT